MNNFEIVMEEILELLRKNPEEFKHANDTLHWLSEINPNSDDVQKISALGHDVERAIKPWNLNGHIDKKLNEKEFRMEHAKRSAEILKGILLKQGASGIEIQRMQNMVLNHEFGGDAEANLIRDADSLANFQWVDDSFGAIDIDSLNGTARRMFERMGAENRRFIKQIVFKHVEIKQTIYSLWGKGLP
jgi:hypothetical protein